MLDKLDSNATIAVCVDPQHVGVIWPRIDHFIRDAIERVGVSSFDDVVDDVVHGDALLWLAWDGEKVLGAGVTRLIGEVCELVAYGGSGEFHLLQTIENYARDEECIKMRILGRKGWVRVLKDYSQPYVVLEKELN